MGIKTEQMVDYLPPKEITEGVDWLGILDSFDPDPSPRGIGNMVSAK